MLRNHTGTPRAVLLLLLLPGSRPCVTLLLTSAWPCSAEGSFLELVSLCLGADILCVATFFVGMTCPPPASWGHPDFKQVARLQESLFPAETLATCSRRLMGRVGRLSGVSMLSWPCHGPNLCLVACRQEAGPSSTLQHPPTCMARAETWCACSPSLCYCDLRWSDF